MFGLVCSTVFGCTQITFRFVNLTSWDPVLICQGLQGELVGIMILLLVGLPLGICISKFQVGILSRGILTSYVLCIASSSCSGTHYLTSSDADLSQLSILIGYWFPYCYYLEQLLLMIEAMVSCLFAIISLNHFSRYIDTLDLALLALSQLSP